MSNAESTAAPESPLNGPQSMVAERNERSGSGEVTVEEERRQLGVAALKHSVTYPSEEYRRELIAPMLEAMQKVQSKPEKGAFDISRRLKALFGIKQLHDARPDLGLDTEIAKDPPRLFAIGEAAAQIDPDLMPILSGQYALVAAAMEKLGNPNSTWLRKQIRKLNDPKKRYLGVALLTELGYGSNVLEMETEAVLVEKEDGTKVLRITSPTDKSIKFAPNVDTGEKVMTIVYAQLIVKGEKRGVFPVVVPMDGSIENGTIETATLPDGMANMTNAAIRYKGVEVPIDAVLMGKHSHIDENGDFHSSLPTLKERFQKSIEVLQDGRMLLSTGAVASMRASIDIFYKWAQERTTSGGKGMIERDNVRDSLASMTARAYVLTAFLRKAQERFAEPHVTTEEKNMLAALVKPIMTNNALDVVQECRERSGVQGFLLFNQFSRYLGNIQGSITAEGENNVLQIMAGRQLPALREFGIVAGTGEHARKPESQWFDMIQAYELALHGEQPTPGHTDGAAIKLAEVTADRMAIEAIASIDVPDNVKDIVRTMIDIFAMEQVEKYSNALNARGLLTQEKAAQLEKQLMLDRQKLSEHLPMLIEAMDVPETGAPMAGNYVKKWMGLLAFRNWRQDHGMAA